MERVPEPELMGAEDQAVAYSNADFSEPHDHFVALAERCFPGGATGRVVDLGCGPADVLVRFARRNPECTLVGIDGSEPMLAEGKARIVREKLSDRVELKQAYLPDADLRGGFAGAISNSLLHHLLEPAVLWTSIVQLVDPGAPVFVMDLMRPESTSQAHEMTELYARDEPEVLKRDLFHSLCAAYSVEEVRSQVESASLEGFVVESVSDRHLVAWRHRQI